MARPEPLDPDAVAAFLAAHPAWRLHEGRLRRELRFGDFVRAFAFMTAVALEAEAADHHPEWSNVYDRVTIDLVTHAAGPAVTSRDTDLAARVDILAPD